MNKQDFIKKIADKAELQNAVVAKAFDSFVEAFEEVLVEEGKLVVGGIGTFEVKERAERQGVNPKTGEKITIAACKAISFKPANALKDSVNK